MSLGPAWYKKQVAGQPGLFMQSNHISKIKNKAKFVSFLLFPESVDDNVCGK